MGIEKRGQEAGQEREPHDGTKAVLMMTMTMLMTMTKVSES